jgi:hypothetical protein
VYSSNSTIFSPSSEPGVAARAEEIPFLEDDLRRADRVRRRRARCRKRRGRGAYVAKRCDGHGQSVHILNSATAWDKFDRIAVVRKRQTYAFATDSAEISWHSIVG